MLIEPTVGRKIWFTPHVENKRMVKLGEQPMDATIVFVNEDGTLNLRVTDHIGNAHPTTHVRLLQEGDAPDPKGGNAYWMPFQRGQAARTEAAKRASGSVRDLEDPQERARFER